MALATKDRAIARRCLAGLPTPPDPLETADSISIRQARSPVADVCRSTSPTALPAPGRGYLGALFQFILYLQKEVHNASRLDGRERHTIDSRCSVIPLCHLIRHAKGLHFADVNVHSPKAPGRFSRASASEPLPAQAGLRLGGLRYLETLRILIHFWFSMCSMIVFSSTTPTVAQK